VCSGSLDQFLKKEKWHEDHAGGHYDASSVTSAAGANRNGCGALLAFDLDGRTLGTFR
jgi:dipeptidase